MYKPVTALRNLFSERFHGDEGATAVEYGLMVSLIAVVIIAAVRLIGTNLTNIFNDVAAAI